MVGAGRSELLRALFGIDPPAGGTVRVGGRAVALRIPFDAIRAGIGMVPEDRKQQGIILETKDGGRTWSHQSYPPLPGDSRWVYGGPGFLAIQMLSDQNLVIVGERGRIWRSSDGGHQWNDVAALTVNAQAEKSGFDPILGHVVFTDAEHGWVTLRSPADGTYPGQFCVTNDGGRTWEGRSLSGQRFACTNTL